MLTKFSVTNYKNFKDRVEFQLDQPGKYKFNTDCLHDGIVAKAIVYGKNATGKSNLGRALLDIKQVLLGDKKATSLNSGEVFLNAQSDLPFALFEYEFKIGSSIIEYSYKKDENQQLISERFKVDDDLIFDLDPVGSDSIDPRNLKKIGVEKLRTEIFFEVVSESEEEDQISFLRWIYNNSRNSDMTLVAKLMDFIEGMNYLNVNKFVENPSSFVSRSSERVSKENKDALEDFLNKMGFQCKLRLHKELDDSNRLYFDLKRPILFYENASSGIRALAEFYTRLHKKLQSSTFLYLDEFDAFFHYEMAERFFEYFKMSYPAVQFVFTSHNTDLISNHIARPDCYFILSSKGLLTSLDKATERELREGHNLEKMYRSGEFLDYE